MEQLFIHKLFKVLILPGKVTAVKGSLKICRSVVTKISSMTANTINDYAKLTMKVKNMIAVVSNSVQILIKQAW